VWEAGEKPALPRNCKRAKRLVTEATLREGPPRNKDFTSDSPSQETGAIRHTNPFRV